MLSATKEKYGSCENGAILWRICGQSSKGSGISFLEEVKFKSKSQGSTRIKMKREVGGKRVLSFLLLL